MIYASASMPMYVSIPLVLIATVILGFLIERVAYKPLRSAPRMSVMISAIGVSYLLQNAGSVYHGRTCPAVSGDPLDQRYNSGFRRQHEESDGDHAGPDHRSGDRSGSSDQIYHDRYG